jgi:hypothetical protein
MYGMYGYALLCAGTMAGMFDTAVKYIELVNGVLDLCWVEHEGVASWVFPQREQVLLPEVDDHIYRFLIDLQITVHFPTFATSRSSKSKPSPGV